MTPTSSLPPPRAAPPRVEHASSWEARKAEVRTKATEPWRTAAECF